MWCVHTFHKFDIVMQHIHRKHEQLPHPLTFLIWLIFDLRIAQYYEMFIGNSMVFFSKHSKVVIAIILATDHMEKLRHSVKRYN